MALTLTPFTKDMKIIAALGDNPNSDNDLTAQGLKEKFDEGGREIKTYINGTLIPEIQNAFTEYIDEVDALIGGDG